MAAELKQLYEVYPNTPKALMPLGVRVNDMIYAGGIIGADPATGELADGLIPQTKLALLHMQTLVERGGAILANIGRGMAYVTSTKDREEADGPWVELFGGDADKPAFKILIAELPPGQLIRLDVLALVGATRTRLDLPNLSAHDPTVKIGNWVFSSRLHGADPANGQMVEGGLEPQTQQLLTNIVNLVEQAGGRAENIVQVTTFGVDQSYMAGSRKVFEAFFPDPAKRPAFNQLISFVRATNALQAEFVAVL